MNGLNEFTESVSGFHSKSAVDQLLLLGWFIEAVEGKPCFTALDMRPAFQKAGIEPPNVSQDLDRHKNKKPPQVVKSGAGFQLEGTVRRSMDAKVGGNPAVVTVSKLLSDLPAKVPNVTERDFAKEALNCYKVKVNRAAIVMAWNLAYDHLMGWLLADAARLVQLNDRIKKRFSKLTVAVVARNDFDELQESQVIDACRTARLLTKNLVEILEFKLKRRNTAARPSTVLVTQAQADDIHHDDFACPPCDHKVAAIVLVGKKGPAVPCGAYRYLTGCKALDRCRTADLQFRPLDLKDTPRHRTRFSLRAYLGDLATPLVLNDSDPRFCGERIKDRRLVHFGDRPAEPRDCQSLCGRTCTTRNDDTCQ